MTLQDAINTILDKIAGPSVDPDELTRFLTSLVPVVLEAKHNESVTACGRFLVMTAAENLSPEERALADKHRSRLEKILTVVSYTLFAIGVRVGQLQPEIPTAKPVPVHSHKWK